MPPFWQQWKRRGALSHQQEQQWPSLKVTYRMARWFTNCPCPGRWHVSDHDRVFLHCWHPANTREGSMAQTYQHGPSICPPATVPPWASQPAAERNSNLLIKHIGMQVLEYMSHDHKAQQFHDLQSQDNTGIFYQCEHGLRSTSTPKSVVLVLQGEHNSQNSPSSAIQMSNNSV